MELAGILFLCAAAFLAGLVDAVVGGGGLIQIPALFSVVPGASPATLFGTNKLSAIFGTASAAWRYARRIDIPWTAVLPLAASALASSYLGAMTVTLLPKAWLRPLMLALLVVMTAYTFVKKDLGIGDRYRRRGLREFLLALFFGGLIGFYDGFFGPGTGSFLIFMFVRFFGLDFLRASASAKIVNVGTNLSALAFFGFHADVMIATGLAMAVFNVAGAVTGSHLALRHGAGMVRGVFLLASCALILKFSWDTFR